MLLLLLAVKHGCGGVVLCLRVRGRSVGRRAVAADRGSRAAARAGHGHGVARPRAKYRGVGARAAAACAAVTTGGTRGACCGLAGAGGTLRLLVRQRDGRARVRVVHVVLAGERLHRVVAARASGAFVRAVPWVHVRVHVSLPVPCVAVERVRAVSARRGVPTVVPSRCCAVLVRVVRRRRVVVLLLLVRGMPVLPALVARVALLVLGKVVQWLLQVRDRPVHVRMLVEVVRVLVVLRRGRRRARNGAARCDARRGVGAR